MSDELTPIIFIPGLMGSIGGEMLGCKSGWGFGAAAWFYRPFIKQLEGLGYVSNKNLFICYYDWRKNCEDIVEQFLLPLLLQVEERYPNQKIDLLCHSMGGLVGRTYIQGKTYNYNIGNLMIFATPNKGSVEVYYLWNMGKIMKKAGKRNQLFEIIRSGYMWLLVKILDIPLGKDSIEELHKSFQGLEDLLPTYDYGYVLCYRDENNNHIYIPSKYIKYKNSFVSKLNKNIDLLYSRIKNLYCFIGTGKETDNILIMDKKSFLNNKDEDIIGSLKTKKGDGTVIVKSAIINRAKTFIMEDGHTGILTSSIGYIADIYNLDRPLIKKDLIEVKEYPLSIIFKKHIGIELKNDNNIVARFSHEGLTTKYEFLIEEFDKNYIWVIFKNIPTGEYALEVFVEDEKDYSIFVVGTNVEEELTYNNVKRMGKDKIGFLFDV